MKGRGKDKTVFALTQRGLLLAEKIAGALGGAVVFEPSMLVEGGLKRESKRAFKRSEALVFISASGIAVRCVAPLLKGKHIDPAVVVVDERGRFAISLISGHMGGANAFAKKIAASIGATAVITTATDAWGLPSVEELAERFSLFIEDPSRIVAVNSAILEGRRAYVIDRNRTRLKAIKDAFGDVFTCRAAFPEKLGERDAAVVITSRISKLPAALARRTLVLRPREIVAGIGCGKGVAKADIKKALHHAFRKAGLSTLSIRNIATIDIKKNERGLVALARELGITIESYGASKLQGVRYPSRPSRVVTEATGAGAVAEPAALISSGAKRVCLKKTKKGRVTIAAAYIP